MQMDGKTEEREAIVKRLDKDNAVLDFNHPRAGKSMEIELTILEILKSKENRSVH